MLADLDGSAAKDADLLLMQLEPEEAQLLELCAIPHTFDQTLLHVLEPSAPSDLITAFLAELPTLPAVTQLSDCFTLHDVVREQMFQRWLAIERREEFRAVSHRLAQHFAGAAPLDPVQDEANRSIVVFHQIGADLAAGFVALHTLYQDYRTTSRYSACEALVRLAGEYRPILSPVERAWLTYYEAEAASDSRNPARAAALLSDLAGLALPAGLAIRVLVHLSAALRTTNGAKAAELYAQRALTLASAEADGPSLLHLVYQELGLVAGQQGDVETAERYLNRAIELASVAGDRLALARAHNSLGTMLQKMAPRRAIAMFEASAACLDEKTDLVRMAQVLNNLGMAYANAGDWEKSFASYERSLEIKRAAGDLYGQASTQLNVARVYQAQHKSVAARDSLNESAVLFEATRDLAAAARARREAARMLRLAGANEAAVDQARAAVALFERADQPEAARQLESELLVGPARKRTWIAWAVLSATVVIGGLALVLLAT